MKPRLIFSIVDRDTGEQLFPQSTVELSFEGLDFKTREKDIREKFGAVSEESLQTIIQADRLVAISEIVDSGFHAVRNSARRTLLNRYTKGQEGEV